MKAVVVEQHGGPEVLSLKEYTLPTPKENEVLIKVMTVGVNPLDVDIREGTLPGPPCPYIPGADLSGYVQLVGSKVTTVKVGDPVYTSSPTSFHGHGSYAEYAAVDSQVVHSLPAKLNFSQGACLGLPYFSAYRALFTRGNAKPGETVLVHGASGGVGIAACQFALARGLRVAGTAGTEAGITIVKSCGAEAVFNHCGEGYIQEIKNYIGSRKFDLILEMKAETNLQHDLDLLAEGGRIIIIGCHGDINITPMTTMVLECDIRGLSSMKTTTAEREETVAAINRGVELGWLVPRISEEFSLADTVDAHKALMEGRGASGKIILSTV